MRLRATIVLAAMMSACGGGDSGEPSIGSALTGRAGPSTVSQVCGGEPDHVVVITNFAYSPAFLTVRVGETVAWVNQETCGDRLDEQLLIPLLGCDAHHQVVTFPEVPGGEALNSGPICSPNGGVAAPNNLSPEAPDPASCADEGNVNVFCHRFTEPGVQSYTCFTNAGHTAAMHGAITVLPAS